MIPQLGWNHRSIHIEIHKPVRVPISKCLFTTMAFGTYVISLKHPNIIDGEKSEWQHFQDGNRVIEFKTTHYQIIAKDNEL